MWDSYALHSVSLHWQKSLLNLFSLTDILLANYNDLFHLGTFLPLALEKKIWRFWGWLPLAMFSASSETCFEGENITSVSCS